MPQALTSTVSWWASLYGNHSSVSVGITFLHLAGLVVGGGAALTEDRRVLRAWRSDHASRVAALEHMQNVHVIVIVGLTVTLVSGVLMTLSDTQTFLTSRIFWIKMGLTALLLANGLFIVRGERLASRTGGRRGWSVLAGAAVSSLTLWLLVVWLGTWLRTAA